MGIGCDYREWSAGDLRFPAPVAVLAAPLSTCLPRVVEFLRGEKRKSRDYVVCCSARSLCLVWIQGWPAEVPCCPGSDVFDAPRTFPSRGREGRAFPICSSLVAFGGLFELLTSKFERGPGFPSRDPDELAGS